MSFFHFSCLLSCIHGVGKATALTATTTLVKQGRARQRKTVTIAAAFVIVMSPLRRPCVISRQKPLKKLTQPPQRLLKLLCHIRFLWIRDILQIQFYAFRIEIRKSPFESRIAIEPG